MLTQIIKLSPGYADVLSYISDKWHEEEQLRLEVIAGSEHTHTRHISKKFFFGMLLDLERRGLIEHKEFTDNSRQWRAKPL